MLIRGKKGFGKGLGICALPNGLEIMYEVRGNCIDTTHLSFRNIQIQKNETRNRDDEVVTGGEKQCVVMPEKAR